jgi:hypothetical protein
MRQGKSFWRGRLSTVDLLLLFSSDQLYFMLKILFTSFARQAALIRRSTVLSLSPQLVFPDLHKGPNTEISWKLHRAGMEQVRMRVQCMYVENIWVEQKVWYKTAADRPKVTTSSLNQTNVKWTVYCPLMLQITYFCTIGFSVSNWQKVQLNTDLFSDMRKYLYAK